MAENPNSTKQVMLNRIYVKDCSFESPRTPDVFNTPMSPDVKVEMRTTNIRVQGDLIEVTLVITADARVDNRSVFLAEVHQAGLFTITGFAEQEFSAVLTSYCPSILFPYAREVISDLVMKGSMPALLLQPVNFDALMLETMAKAAAEAANK